MLKKVLRYDFKSVYKYWWIGAVVSFALAIVAGFAVAMMESGRILPAAVEVIGILAVVVAFLANFAFVFMADILVLIRYYKNFYSDEGYLTFTLPVKRSQLLNSKLILGIITFISSVGVVGFNLIISLLIGFNKSIVFKTLFADIKDAYLEIYEEVGPCLFPIIGEVLLLFILLSFASMIFTFICINIGATISKKAKVLSAIGVYVGANSVVTFFLQMFSIFVVGALSNWLDNFDGTELSVIVTLMLLVVVFFVSLLCALMYALHYTLLDKKLNMN